MPIIVFVIVGGFIAGFQIHNRDMPAPMAHIHNASSASAVTEESDDTTATLTFSASGVTGTAPSSTCEAHAGTSATLPLDNCKRGVASLALDSDACGSNIGGATGCTSQSAWTIVQDDVEQTGMPTNEGACGSQIQYPIAIKKTEDGYTYIGGSASLNIANGGSCDATLSSVLFVLEQSVGSYTGSGPTSYSYGPGGLNFYSWAVSGVENTALTATCDNTEAPFPLASTCDLDSPTPCRVNIPYLDHSIYNVATGGDLLDLTDVVIPKSPFDGGDGCNVALSLNVSYIFKIQSSVYAQLIASPSKFRVNALVSFDACCPRGAACGIDLTCDGSGRKNIVRTVQVHSSTFTLPATCSSRCDCVDVMALPANSATSTDGSCSGSIVADSFEDQRIATVCSSTNLTYPVSICCGPNSCPCGSDASGTNYAVQHSNMVSLVPHSNDCVDLVSDSTLLASDTALGTSHCNYPTPISCVLGSWSTWGPVDEDCITKCFTNNTFRRPILTAPCHTDAPCGETQQSIVTACPPVCQLSAWTAWSTCTCPTTSTSGVRTRTRSVLQDRCGAPGTCTSNSPQSSNCSCPLPPVPTPSPTVVLAPSTATSIPPSSSSPPPVVCSSPQACTERAALTCDIFGKCNGTTISCATNADCAAVGRCNVTRSSCRVDSNCPCAANLCTYTKGGYAVCLDKSQNPPQCAKMNQSSYYPLGIGYPSKFLPFDTLISAGKRSLTWTTWQKLALVINGGSTPALLPPGKNLVDSTAPIDVFQAQLATATLNRLILPYELYFRGSCASTSVPAHLKTLFAGMPVTQILAFISAYDASVSTCLSALTTSPNCASILSNSNNNPSGMTSFLDFFNRAFDNCLPSAESQGCFASTPSS